MKLKLGAETERLMKQVKKSILSQTKSDLDWLITHHFKLEQIIEAYKTFGDAAKEKALKVILEA